MRLATGSGIHAAVITVAAGCLGILAVGGFAPFNLYALPVLSIAGLMLLCERHPRLSGFSGYTYGLGLFGSGVSWIYTSLHVYGGMSGMLAVLATSLFCAAMALFPWMGTTIALRLAPERPIRLLLAWPVAWVFSEWIRSWLFTGFPWLTLGYSQIPGSPLAGIAPVAGIHGVTLLLVLCSGLLVLAWLDHRRAFMLAGATLVLAVGAALSLIPWTHPLGEPLRVSLIQGNVAQDTKWLPEQVDSTLNEYARLIRQSSGSLVILPETALPMFLHQIPEDYLESLVSLGRTRGADILVGVPEQQLDGSYFNSVVSLGASVPGIYRKEHLVPFGEYIPLKPVFGRIVEILHIPLTDFMRGPPERTPLQVAGQRVGVNICYEDVFGNEIIRQLPAATLLVNVSNDAWFGDSIAPWQHMQMSQARALETGRTVLRATNTGLTAIIDARGQVLDHLPTFSTGTLEGTAQGRGGTTPYVRWGDTPVIAGLCLAGLLLAARRAKKRV